MQRFKIVSHPHAQIVHPPKFQIFRNFYNLSRFCYEHHGNQKQECSV